MTMFIGRASDYTEWLKQVNKDKQGVSQWEQFFLEPLTQQFTSGVGAAQQELYSTTSAADTKFKYDISDAYSAYRSKQESMQQSNLWSGVKSGFSSYLESAYTSSFGQSKATRDATISGATNKFYDEYGKQQEKFAGALEKENERLLKEGKKYADLERMAYDFYTYVGDPTFNPMKNLKDYYNVNNDGTITLNEEGVDFWDKLLNDKWGEEETTFAEYLYQESPEMFEFLSDNIDNVREMVGGLARDDFEYSPDERKYKLDVEDIEKNVKQEYESGKIKGNLKEDFDSNKEKLDYYSGLQNKLKKADDIYLPGSFEIKEIARENPAPKNLRPGTRYEPDKYLFDLYHNNIPIFTININGEEYKYDVADDRNRYNSESGINPIEHIKGTKDKLFNEGELYTTDNGKTYKYVNPNGTVITFKKGRG